MTMPTNTTSESVEQFLARGGTITRCPSSDHQAPSLAKMRRDDERRLLEAEHAAERYVETFGAARASGLSVSDALDEAGGSSDAKLRGMQTAFSTHPTQGQ